MEKNKIPVGQNTRRGFFICPRGLWPPPPGGVDLKTAPSPIRVGEYSFCHKLLYFCFDRNPPGCGALFLQRAAAGACKKQTAAPAPPRLYLPQAAARLRSPPPIAVPPALRARPGGAPDFFSRIHKVRACFLAGTAKSPQAEKSSLWFRAPAGAAAQPRGFI